MADVFISYASPDRGRAEKLAHALSKRGISVWWDRELAAGDDFEAVIDRELAAARLVIVVWSEHAVVSPWVRSEAAEGLKQNKLLPVRLDDARIPRPFDQLHTTRIRTGPATEGFASLIVTRLRDTVSKRPQKKSESQPAAWVPAFVAVFVAVVGTVLILSRSFFPSTGLEGSTSIASEAGAQDRVTRAVGVTARPGATSLDQRALRVLLENLNTSDRPADAAVFALLETGNVASAIDQLEASYEVMREHSSPDERVDLLHQLAGLSFYSDVPRSKAFYEEILDITPNDFHATRRLATIAYWQSESAIADRYFLQASEIGAPTLEDELDLDIRHGMAMLQEYRFDEALDKLEAAAAVAEQSGHDELSSLAWTRIAHGHYL
ncbi:MAG: toll/interleukin-1 receptor domain-containing protein, partial [Pseudomonadota bacterium]